MNKPTASKMGVKILIMTFIPIDGIKAGMLSALCLAPWYARQAKTVVASAIRQNTGSSPKHTPTTTEA